MSEKAALCALDMPAIDAIFARSAEDIVARLNDPAEGLVAVRKGSKRFPGDEKNANRDAYCAAEVKTWFGAADAAGLKDRVTRMVLKLNA